MSLKECKIVCLKKRIRFEVNSRGINMSNCKPCTVLNTVFTDYGKSNSLVTVYIIKPVAGLIFFVLLILCKTCFFGKLNSIANSLTLNG